MSTGDFTKRTVAPLTNESSGESCPECGGPLASDGQETCCEDCGLVVAMDVIDRGPEWRFDGGRKDRRRTGAPVTPARHDRGLSSEIGWNRVGSERKRRQLSRLRREHNRARLGSKADRNLAEALGEIARLASALELPRSTRERAAFVYRQARDRGLLMGRSIEALAAASVYAACRCDGLVRSVAEVASVARCSRIQTVRRYRELNRELGLAAPVSRPAAFVPKLVSALDAPDRVRERAYDLVELAEAAGYASGRHPGGLAAACVYRAGHEYDQLYTQAEVAAPVEVSTRTVSGRLAELRELVE